MNFIAGVHILPFVVNLSQAILLFVKKLLYLILGNPPTIDMFAIEGTGKTSFKIDEKVEFYCEAKGTPPLHYVWLRNNDVINEGNKNKHTVIAGETTEGEYRCKVWNLFGSNSSGVVQIEVGK